MRRKYSEQTKLAAVLAYRDGNGGLKAIAKAHGVDVTALRKWIADYREHGEAANTRQKQRTQAILTGVQVSGPAACLRGRAILSARGSTL